MLQFIPCSHYRPVPLFRHGIDLVEFAGMILLQVRADDDVRQFDVPFDIFLNDHIEDLFGNGGEGACGVQFAGFPVEIHGDYGVGSHFKGHVHREVIDDPAVHQGFFVDFDGSENGGHGHAGVDGIRQITLSQNNLFPGFQDDGHGSQGDGQIVEIVDIRDMQRCQLKCEPEFGTRYKASGEYESRLSNSDFKVEEIRLVIEFPAVDQVPMLGNILEHIIPVDGREFVMNRIGAQSRGVHPSHHRSDTGAGDPVYGYPQLFKCFQGADVSGSTCSAAAESQADDTSINTLFPRFEGE